WGNGAPDNALALQTEAIRIFEKQLGPDHPETIHALFELGSTEEQGRHDAKAELLLRDTIARYERLYGPGSAWLERPMASLAIVMERSERPQEAEVLLRRAIAIAKPVLGRFDEAGQAFRDGEAARPEGDESVHVSLLRESGRLHLRMQQYAEAERELDQAFSLSRRVLGEDKGIVWYTGSEWGRALAGEGRLAEAEAIQRQAAARLASLIGPEAYHNCLVEEALADTLEQRGGAGAEV